MMVRTKRIPTPEKSTPTQSSYIHIETMFQAALDKIEATTPCWNLYTPRASWYKNWIDFHTTLMREKTTWDGSCEAIGPLRSPSARCWTCLFYLPGLNLTDKNHLQDLAYTSKYGSHTSADALPWSKNQVLLTYCWELRSWVSWNP
jgi:hypothetical protein